MMFYEMLDALSDYYKKCPDIIVDILLWLKGNCDIKTKTYVDDWFEKNHYCSKCGTRLETRTWKEERPYGESIAYETMSELICPECGVK